MESAPIWYVILLGFSLAVILCVVVHKTNFCTMGSISDWVNMGRQGLDVRVVTGHRCCHPGWCDCRFLPVRLVYWQPAAGMVYLEKGFFTLPSLAAF